MHASLKKIQFDPDTQIKNITLVGWIKGLVAFSLRRKLNVTSAHTP